MVIPADHELTAKAIGKTSLFKMILKAPFAYMNTMKYFLRHKGFKSLIAFLNTKTIVPTGEGSGELAYYFIGSFLRKFPQLVPYPRWIELEVTTRCNKHCVLCEHTYWNEPSQDLTFQQFQQIIEMFPKLTWINLTGEGDAFLNKDYLQMIRYLKDRSVAVYLVDSFNLINRNIAYELVRFGVDGIYVSIDAATKKTYEKIKVGCNFESTIQNIKNILEAKKAFGSPIPEICFRYVITKWNFLEMPSFIHLIRNLASKNVWGDMAKIHFTGLLTFPEIEHLYVPNLPTEIINETFKAGENPDSLPIVLAHTEPEKFPSINRCLAYMEPYIMMGGFCLPCCAVLMSNRRSWLREHAFGNVFNQHFKEIWDSQRYRRFRYTVNKEDMPIPVFCKGCRAYDTSEREKLHGVDYSL